MEYSYDYDIRQTAEHNRRAKINNFMNKAPVLPKDVDQWFFELAAGRDYMIKKKKTESFGCTACRRKIQQIAIDANRPTKKESKP